MVWLRDEGVVVDDEDGTPMYLQGYLLDVTQQREAEERRMDELRPHSIAGPNRTRGREEDDTEPVLLGDVVLCPQVAAAQAKQHGHSTQAELELLTVHGVLHLLGYDHADPEEEAEMFGLQSELLRDWRDQLASGQS